MASCTDVISIVPVSALQMEVPMTDSPSWQPSASNGTQYILTKGDNNVVDDRGLYNEGKLWIHREDVVGRVKGYVRP